MAPRKKHSRNGTVVVSTSTDTSVNETPVKKKKTDDLTTTTVRENPVTIEELSEKIDRLTQVITKEHEQSKEISGFVFDLQTENEKMKREIQELRSEKNKLKDSVRELQMGLRLAKDHSNRVEQWGRLWNVRIHGIENDRQDEELEECVTKVMNFLESRLGLIHFPRPAIDIAHRLGVYRHGQDRAVIIRFHSRMDRLVVLRNRHRLRSTGYRVVEDLTQVNFRLLQRVKDTAGPRNAWTRDGKVYARLESGRIVQVEEHTPLQDLFEHGVSFNAENRKDVSTTRPTGAWQPRPTRNSREFRTLHPQRTLPRSRAERGGTVRPPSQLRDARMARETCEVNQRRPSSQPRLEPRVHPQRTVQRETSPSGSAEQPDAQNRRPGSRESRAGSRLASPGFVTPPSTPLRRDTSSRPQRTINQRLNAADKLPQEIVPVIVHLEDKNTERVVDSSEGDGVTRQGMDTVEPEQKRTDDVVNSTNM